MSEPNVTGIVLKVTGRELGFSKAVRQRNPGLFGQKPVEFPVPLKDVIHDKPKRVRQDTKPVLNKLESRWLERLKADFPNESFRYQDRRYKLANGVWYKPDITCARHEWPCEEARSLRFRETCWECKGPKEMKNMARAMLVIKMAAHQWPEIRWVLVWEDGGWNEQEILP